MHQVGKPIEWPEPGLTLNYGDRRNSDMRTFKYLHQMCLLHRSNYVSSNQIRHLYLIDGFLTTVDAQNPFALYALARSNVRVECVLHEVQTRLQAGVLRINDNTWQPLGEKFFGLIVRARYATTHPGLPRATGRLSMIAQILSLQFPGHQMARQSTARAAVLGQRNRRHVA